MKKLSTVLLIFVSAVSLLVVGCQKDVTAPLSTTSTDGMKLIQSVDPKPIQTFSELNADVKVEDGVLVFTSSKDFENTINFLQDTSLARSLKKQEIKRWEASLRSFISVYNYYEMAIQEGYSDLQNQDAFNSMKAKYQGKVRFLENEAIEPLIDNGNIFGRIISEKGQYKIGQSIVQYHKGKVISIPDGDLDKLALAMRNLNEDVSKGIYVHDLFLGQKNPNDVQLRVAISPTCSNSCPVSQNLSKQVDMNGETYRLTATYDILDNGSQAGFSGIPTRFINVSVKIKVIQQRKTFWGFSPSYSTGFTWGFGWGFDLSLVSAGGISAISPPPTCCDEGIGKPAGGQSWSQASELNHTISIWTTSSANISNQLEKEKFLLAQLLFCARRTGLNANSMHVNNANNTKPLFVTQFCQRP